MRPPTSNWHLPSRLLVRSITIRLSLIPPRYVAAPDLASGQLLTLLAASLPSAWSSARKVLGY